MLELEIRGPELYDEERNQFFSELVFVLELEHSLVSLSKWESKYEVPFIGDADKTTEQTIDYIKMMTITPNVPPEIYQRLSNEQYGQVNEYISAKMTATWFNEAQQNAPRGMNRETVTAEVVYHWMIALQIPFECQHWHLNRLFTLIKVCSHKNNPEKNKKMSRSDLAARNRALNAQRKAKLGSRG